MWGRVASMGCTSASENDARSEITPPPSRQSITQPIRVRFFFFFNTFHVARQQLEYKLCLPLFSTGLSLQRTLKDWCFDRWTILIIQKSSLDMKSLNLCSLLPNLFEITHLMPNNNFIWFPKGEKNCQSVFFFQTCKCPRLLSCTSPRPKRPTCVGFANCCVAKKAFRCLVLTH